MSDLVGNRYYRLFSHDKTHIVCYVSDAILLSQRADGFVFLADTIFGSLGTTIYVILYKLFGFGSQALARM